MKGRLATLILSQKKNNREMISLGVICAIYGGLNVQMITMNQSLVRVAR